MRQILVVFSSGLSTELALASLDDACFHPIHENPQGYLKYDGSDILILPKVCSNPYVERALSRASNIILYYKKTSL
jgi:hypothetical protein